MADEIICLAKREIVDRWAKLDHIRFLDGDLLIITTIMYFASNFSLNTHIIFFYLVKAPRRGRRYGAPNHSLEPSLVKRNIKSLSLNFDLYLFREPSHKYSLLVYVTSRSRKMAKTHSICLMNHTC